MTVADELSINRSAAYLKEDTAYRHCNRAFEKCAPVQQAKAILVAAPDTALISSTERLRMAPCLGRFGALLMVV